MSTLPERMTVTIGAETGVYVRLAIPAPTEDWIQTAMQHYSQSDKRWADFEYAPNYTMRGAGCLITSIAMIGSLYYGEGITPLSVAQVLKDAGAFDGGMLARPEVLSVVWPRLVYAGRADWHGVPADLGALRDELDHSGATVILVKYNAHRPDPIADNTHFVVLTDITLHGAQIVDSFDGQIKDLLDTQYALTGWLPSRAIYGVRRYRITPTNKGGDNA